jgi:hypothetical protein
MPAGTGRSLCHSPPLPPGGRLPRYPGVTQTGGGPRVHYRIRAEESSAAVVVAVGLGGSRPRTAAAVEAIVETDARRQPKAVTRGG